MGLLADRDPGTVRIVSDAAGLVGRQLAVVCNLLARARVVVEAGELVLGPIRTRCSATSRPTSRRTWSSGRWSPRHTAFDAIALAFDGPTGFRQSRGRLS
jgi:hypothetical protein